MILAQFEFPPISHVLIWKEVLFEGTPFAVNKTVILMWVAAVIVMALFVTAGRRRALVPAGVQNVGEAGIEFIDRQIVDATMGAEGRHFTPFFASMFFFILFLNLWEVVPVVQFPATSRMAVPLYLAIQTWLIMLIVGIRRQGPLGYFKNSLFPPGVPMALKPLLALIEFASRFVLRPFTLAVRLFANMLAGHMLLVTFYLLSAALWIKAPLVVALPLPFAMAIAMTAFEILVAVLQAYIFTILTAVYVDESMHPHL